MKNLPAIVAWGCLILMAGCTSPKSGPAKYAAEDLSPATKAPPGKCLVCIHRPSDRQGQWVKTGVWDGPRLIVNFGRGNSVAYVCDPGQHYFLSRSFDQAGVVEANLKPDCIYDLWIDPGPYLAPSLKIKPVKPGSKARAKVPEWLAEHRWMKRDASADEHERQDRDSVQKQIQEFIAGPEKHQLQHLAPEDHR